MIDIAGELRAALVAEGLAGDKLDERIERAVERALSKRDEQLRPLAELLGISTVAAAARLRRDARLRALGVPCGRRLLFRASDLRALRAVEATK